MSVLETERLALREMSVDDAALILELLNEPSFLRYVGDKGVRTLRDARRYVLDGPVASYARLGFGLYLVERKSDGAPMGMCGLLKREELEDVDVGFAFLPEFWARGYATESAAAVVGHARDDLGLGRLLAVTSRDNRASMRVLGKLGFALAGLVKLSDDGEELNLFASEAPGE